MDVSVIIPMHNGGELIHEQLDALAAQKTDLQWEVIVGDNRSTDGSPDAVRERAKDFPVPLRVAEAFRVAGASHARNAAAALATGRVLAMCDADDRVAGDWVQQAYDAVTARTPMVAGMNRRLEVPFRADSDVLNPRILHGRGAQSGNVAMLRSLFMEVGGFDESLPPYGVEDSDLSSRVLQSGRTITPAPSMVLYFRETEGIRPKLTKIYSSGQAEAVLWARGHRAQGSELTYAMLARDVFRYPADALAVVRTHGIKSLPKWLLRHGAVRTGRIVGLKNWVRSGRAGEPVYPFAGQKED